MAIAVGTRVRFIKQHGFVSIGDEGVVTDVDRDGRLAVDITNRGDCTKIVKPPALGVPPDSVTTRTNC